MFGIFKKALNKTKDAIQTVVGSEKKDKLEKVVAALLKKETLEQEEFEALLKEETEPSPKAKPASTPAAEKKKSKEN